MCDVLMIVQSSQINWDFLPGCQFWSGSERTFFSPLSELTFSLPLSSNDDVSILNAPLRTDIKNTKSPPTPHCSKKNLFFASGAILIASGAHSSHQFWIITSCNHWCREFWNLRTYPGNTIQQADWPETRVKKASKCLVCTEFAQWDKTLWLCEAWSLHSDEGGSVSWRCFSNKKKKKKKERKNSWDKQKSNPILKSTVRMFAHMKESGS